MWQDWATRSQVAAKIDARCPMRSRHEAKMAKGATPARPRGKNGEPRAPKMRQDWLKRSQVAAKMDARCPDGRQKWSQDGPGSQPARPRGRHGEPRAPKKQNRANLPRGMQFLGPGRQVIGPAVGSRRWGGRWGCILIWRSDRWDGGG